MRKNDNPHRRVFYNHYKRFPKPGYHLHHIDGNPNNNVITNLLEVTPRQHYDIHFTQGDWGACVLLASAAKITPEELHNVQREHGLSCVAKGTGIHSESSRSRRSIQAKQNWKKNPPGRKPVTNGTNVIKLKTDEDVRQFLNENPDWKRGVPSSFKKGLAQSKRRISSAEARQLATDRIKNGTHNMLTTLACPHCGKKGQGTVMKRWHFDNCKSHDEKYK